MARTPSTELQSIRRAIAPGRIRALNRQPNRSRVEDTLHAIGFIVRGGTLSDAEAEAGRGLLWAYQTGRLPMQAEWHLITLRAQDILQLVADCAQAVTNQNDAWHWYGRKLCEMYQAAEAAKQAGR